MAKLKIWHKIKHNDATVSEVDYERESFRDALAAIIKENGAFIKEDGRLFFVPFHQINHIEVIE